LKKCIRCGIEKPLSEYGSQGYGKLRAKCKKCYNERKTELLAGARKLRRKSVAVAHLPHTVNVPKNCAICESKIDGEVVTEFRLTGENFQQQEWRYCPACWAGMMELREKGNTADESIWVPMLSSMIDEGAPAICSRRDNRM